MPRPQKVQPKATEPRAFTHKSGQQPTILTPANDPPSAALTLTLNGQAIRDRGEMLSLTDMWKAAGSDPSKRPVDWARKEGSSFIEYMKAVLEVPHGHFQTTKGGRGVGGSTFAHWQIAIAYAKYLSNEFHAACNVVIRERMEGRLPVASLPANIAEVIERNFGISRMLAHKVKVMEDALVQTRADFMTALIETDPRVAAVGFKPSLEVLKDHDVPSKGRRGFSQKVSNRLRRFSLVHKHPMRESHETGRWLFHVDAIAAWLEAEGQVMIRNQKAKLAGDGELFRLVKS